MSVTYYTVEKIHKQFALAFHTIHYHKFVKDVLHAEPNSDDVWQLEKWENFQRACNGLLRLPKEHLQCILEYQHQEQE